MKWQKSVMTAVSAAAIAVLVWGCSTRRTVSVHEPRRPVYVSTYPSASAAAPVAVVQVQQAPPEPITEVKPPAPHATYVWKPGYWLWTGDQWAWNPGHWMKPPRPKSEWVPGHWDRVGNTWHYREGYWR